jgi:hypothetical protein
LPPKSAQNPQCVAATADLHQPATTHPRGVAVLIASCRQKVHKIRGLWRQLQIFTTDPAPLIKHQQPMTSPA